MHRRRGADRKGNERIRQNCFCPGRALSAAEETGCKVVYTCRKKRQINRVGRGCGAGAFPSISHDVRRIRMPEEAGEWYSYLMLSRLPALRRAFQSVGRHVRRPGKRGIVFFLDERFGSQAVRDLMPSWLKSNIMVGDMTPGLIEHFSREFWSSWG